MNCFRQNEDMDSTKVGDTQYWNLFLALGWGQRDRAKKSNINGIYPWHHTKRRPKGPGLTDHLAVAQLFAFRANTAWGPGNIQYGS